MHIYSIRIFGCFNGQKALHAGRKTHGVIPTIRQRWKRQDKSRGAPSYSWKYISQKLFLYKIEEGMYKDKPKEFWYDMIKCCDKDKDGYLNFEEFVNMMK